MFSEGYGSPVASKVVGTAGSGELDSSQAATKKVEAQQLRAEIYSWFTAGFDTKDWQEVKALLQE